MSVIYTITTDTYSSSLVEGLLLRTKPFIIHEANVTFGKRYLMRFKTDKRVSVYHTGSTLLELTKLENNKSFTARGKIFIIEFEENETTTFNPISLVEV